MPLPDPADLSPAARANELAALFATALRRLHRIHSRPILAPQNLPETPANELASRPEPSVSVHAD